MKKIITTAAILIISIISYGQSDSVRYNEFKEALNELKVYISEEYGKEPQPYEWGQLYVTKQNERLHREWKGSSIKRGGYYHQNTCDTIREYNDIHCEPYDLIKVDSLFKVFPPCKQVTCVCPEPYQRWDCTPAPETIFIRLLTKAELTNLIAKKTEALNKISDTANPAYMQLLLEINRLEFKKSQL